MNRRSLLKSLSCVIAAPAIVPASSLMARARDYASRILLSQKTTFYVRRDGNNENDGLSDTQTGAFATGQGAIDHLARHYDGGDNQITIQFSREEHNAGISLRPVPGAGAVVFQGDIENPRNCPLFVTNVPGPIGRHCFNNPGSQGIFIVQGFWLQTLGHEGYSLLRTTEKGKIKYAFIDFGQCTGIHVMAGRDGHAFSNGNNTISGGGVAHYHAEQGGFVQEVGRVINFVGKPQFTLAFAHATQRGSIIIPGDKWIGDIDNDKTPTHRISSMSYIGTNQQGAAYLPGNPALGYIAPNSFSMLD